jgi:hypothetical protein
MSSPEPAPKKEKKEKKSKEEKAAKKARKEAKRAAAALEASSSAVTSVSAPPPVPAAPPVPPGARPLHVAAQVAHAPSLPSPSNSVSLMLFYQYIEPLLSPDAYQALLRRAQALGEEHGCTGRMRCAREGLNCTLTGSHGGLRAWAAGMRAYHPAFLGTEFKLTDGLPEGQRFPKLNVIPCEEIVNYGLGGAKAPPIDRTAVHLEPAEYHEKMKESDTVIIDVRNHYEAIIGRFDPPPGGAKMLDPKMRKSTEFPVWLNKQSTKDELKGKQVLMCVWGEWGAPSEAKRSEAKRGSGGGVRGGMCERATPHEPSDLWGGGGARGFYGRGGARPPTTPARNGPRPPQSDKPSLRAQSAPATAPE